VSLKLFVNNPELWNAFTKELDGRLSLVHRNLEQLTKPEDLYRLQGEAQAYNKLKLLRDKVNNE